MLVFIFQKNYINLYKWGKVVVVIVVVVIVIVEVLKNSMEFMVIGYRENVKRVWRQYDKRRERE